MGRSFSTDPRHIENILDADLAEMRRPEDIQAAKEDRRRAAGRAALTRGKKQQVKIEPRFSRFGSIGSTVGGTGRISTRKASCVDLRRTRSHASRAFKKVFAPGKTLRQRLYPHYPGARRNVSAASADGNKMRGERVQCRHGMELSRRACLSELWLLLRGGSRTTCLPRLF